VRIPLLHSPKECAYTWKHLEPLKRFTGLKWVQLTQRAPYDLYWNVGRWYSAKCSGQPGPVKKTCPHVKIDDRILGEYGWKRLCKNIAEYEWSSGGRDHTANSCREHLYFPRKRALWAVKPSWLISCVEASSREYSPLSIIYVRYASNIWWWSKIWQANHLTWT